MAKMANTVSICGLVSNNERDTAGESKLVKREEVICGIQYVYRYCCRYFGCEIFQMVETPTE